jgi:uncharacterized protein YhaN
MSAGTQAALKKQRDQIGDEAQSWYDKWGEVSEELDGVKKEVGEKNAENAKLKQQITGLEDDTNEQKRQITNLKKEKKQKEQDVEEQKKLLREAKELAEHLKQQLADAESWLDDERKLRDTAEEKRDAEIAYRAELEKQLDELEGVNKTAVDASQKNDQAADRLEEIRQIFEREFRGMAEGLSLDEYLRAFQDQQQSNRLRRDDSSTSLDSRVRDQSHARQRNRQVSGNSIDDELKDVDTDDEELFGKEGDTTNPYADDDETITDPGALREPLINGWGPGEVAEVQHPHAPGRSMTTQTQQLSGNVTDGVQTAPKETWTPDPAGSLVEQEQEQKTGQAQTELDQIHQTLQQAEKDLAAEKEHLKDLVTKLSNTNTHLQNRTKDKEKAQKDWQAVVKQKQELQKKYDELVKQQSQPPQPTTSAPQDPPQQPLGFSGTMTTAETAPTLPPPAPGPSGPKPPEQQLGLSPITTTINTTPIPPQPIIEYVDRPVEVIKHVTRWRDRGTGTTIRAPRNLNEVLGVLPWWALFLLSILFAAWMYTYVQMRHERYALEQNIPIVRYEREVTLGHAWNSPAILRLEAWLGVDGYMPG